MSRMEGAGTSSLYTNNGGGPQKGVGKTPRPNSAAKMGFDMIGYIEKGGRKRQDRGYCSYSQLEWFVIVIMLHNLNHDQTQLSFSFEL